MITASIVTRKWLSVPLVAGLAILSMRCGGGGGSGVTDPTDPSIALSETSKSFSATAGSGDLTAQTVEVSNSGGGTLDGLTVAISYAAGQPIDWLTASLSGTTAPSTLTLTPSTGGLTAGTYTASVAVTSAAASNSPRSLNVTLTVTPPAAAPTISLSSASQTFSAATGGPDPEAQTVSVTNGGGGTLSGLALNVAYGVGEPTGWLSATLSETTAPSTLTLTVTTGSLTEATYTASVAVTSVAASNSPQFLDVTFTVTLPPPTDLTATAASSSQINLTWSDNASTEDGYKIERCTGASCTDFTHFTTVGRNATSFPDGGLSAGTSYSYRVQGSNDAGNSPYSNVASATTLTASEELRTFFASFDNMLINNTSDPSTADRVSESSELDVGSKYFYRVDGNYTALQYASLMKFDVQSEIAGKTILEATLSLHQFVLPAEFDGEFKLAAIQTSWNPSTTSWRTWSEMGEPYPDGQLDFAALQPVETPLEFDVTGIVQKWADGTLENNGFQIWEPSPVPPGHDSNQALEIQSLEVFRGEGTRPQLFIHYR